MDNWGRKSREPNIAAWFATFLMIAGGALFYGSPAYAAEQCKRMLSADVVAFDMPLMFNRLGAQNINGMMYALRRDVVDKSNMQPIGSAGSAGNVTLRPDKRPRPLVLRMGAGDCMQITLTNLLTPVANPFEVQGPADCDAANPGEVRSGIPFNCEIDDQVAGREISLRFQGTELVNSIADDGSFVGQNASSLVDPGQTMTYTIHAPKDGAFLGTSNGAPFGGEGLGGQTASGLWAVLNVNPENAAFYRSQLTNEELALALDTSNSGLQDANGDGYSDATGHPILNYEATYPAVQPWISEGKAGLPIVNMFTPAGETVHTAIDAIVAYGPDLKLGSPADGAYAGYLGHFPASSYPLESVGKRNPTVPNRLEPFREFTVAFHDEVSTKQAFPKWFEDPILGHTLHGVRDSFMINYGSGGIGSEIIANRLGVGPMHDCVNCAYEEFFLTFGAVGEVGQLTDIPANFGLENCDPTLANCAANGPKANYVLFPADPSNVHHSYTGDATAFRNLHAGPGEQHVFHLHNHQWLFNADDDNSNYLDAQGLGPGSGYAYWINFGGSGNRNKTAGDAIFHCHFYPHFAQGMWEMWRLHDAFEPGTELQTTADGGGVHISFTVDGLGLGDGTPAAGARALPDAEVIAGAPTPAVVPLPGKAMAPMPAAGVTVVANDNQIEVCLDSGGMRVPRDAATGACVAGTTPTLQAVGSLTSVDRASVYGADGVLGGGDDVNPGYPFWIAGMEHVVGSRPPTPPLDMISNAQATALKNSGNPLWSHPGFTDVDAIDGWDGGLPRFAVEGYSAGSKSAMAVTRLDMSKEIKAVKPVFFPEEGTDLEQVAMAFHAERCHDSAYSDGQATPAECADDPTTADVRAELGGFVTNGAKPVPGAPYQEPCIDDRGALQTGAEGWFFGGSLAKMSDTSAMTVRGASPHNAADPRYYKAANVQFDAVFNKLGYHFPQERIITLWQDVVPTIKQERPPEPFVLRLNTFDCTQYVHSNVVPKVYELDDYQVRTPTDIIGQHIHLPKWDLTSADGSANGWNYEDGTLSPQAVVEMIEAINHWNTDPANTPVITRVDGQPVVTADGQMLSATNIELHPSDHPFFGNTEFALQWKGARSTLQRWFADPVVNVNGVDRGLGIIFTHDHYGPSTHQQVGLYATVLVEPAGSKWVHNEEGVQLGLNPGGDSPAGRVDGGPTSWQAAILTGDNGFGSSYSQNVGSNEVESHREFYFEYSDFQHAYQPGVFVGVGANGLPVNPYDPTDANGDGFIDNPIVAADPDTFRDAIQPPYRQQASLVNGFPVDIWEFPTGCPGGAPRPCPEAITADDPGMYVVNYRNESLTARIFDPNRNCPDGKKGCQAKGRAGDLSFAMQTRTDRAISALNKKFGAKVPEGYKDNTPGSLFLPPINQKTAINKGDPFTPMMRAFDGDRVRVKMQAGGQEEEHTTSIHGLKWLQAGSGFGEAKNSGWRNAQAGGISEQFSFGTTVFADHRQQGATADYAYSSNTSLDGWVTGTWGVLRSYRNNQNDLFRLPGNDATVPRVITNRDDFDDDDEEDEDGEVIGKIKGVCPKNAPKRVYDVTAILANRALRKQPAGTVTVQDLFPGAHMGRKPDNNRRTLVYNSRTDVIGGQAVIDEETGEIETLPTHMGPLHDPTGILYVLTKNLKPVGYPNTAANRKDTTIPVRLKAGVPVEPIVLRAAAGECIKVKLRNRLLDPATNKADDGPVYKANGKRVFECKTNMYADEYGLVPLTKSQVKCDKMPDLANTNAIVGILRRDRGVFPNGMTTFQNNLMAPSAHVGMHPALVEYDVTRSDGTNVGLNPTKTVPPGRKRTYQWYAGNIGMDFARRPNGRIDKRTVTFTPTPIEFGGFNIMPADKIKQGQKGLFGAGVIYPENATWNVDGGTNAEATVTVGLDSFRDMTVTTQKGASVVYADSFPVENLLGEGDFGVAEDAQDMGMSALNYASEPMWFRFGLVPHAPAGNAGPGSFGGVANSSQAFSNSLTGVDPETPVFSAGAGDPFRMHVLFPFGPGRGSTFDLHGHVWQRDPYVCPGDADFGLPGKCDTGDGHVGSGSVGSQALGDNPIGFHLGGIESWFPGQHYEIVLPSAGGTSGVQGDYLFRDHQGSGTTGGLWGILRVEAPAP